MKKSILLFIVVLCASCGTTKTQLARINEDFGSEFSYKIKEVYGYENCYDLEMAAHYTLVNSQIQTFFDTLEIDKSKGVSPPFYNVSVRGIGFSGKGMVVAQVKKENILPWLEYFFDYIKNRRK